MSFVVAQTETMTAAANGAAAIGSAVSRVNAAAVASTTEVAVAAGDEVSAAIAALFSEYGQSYQALSAQVATFNRQFVQTLRDAATSYAGTEVAGVSALGQGLATPASAASSPLGNGIAFVMGGSGLPTPYQRYAETADMLYLKLLGFTGTPQILTTPELTSNYDVSIAAGSKILTNAIMGQIQGGLVNAQNPAVVFGYSQSSVLSTFTMQQLHALGVPTDYVHFVLVGNTANPNGGLLTSFDIPPGMKLTIPGVVTLGNPTPNNLYPTDVYTLEYDGWADFPHYPINVLSDLNAFVGMYTRHLAYLGLQPSQIANAITLPTTGDTLVNYHMIPSEGLPLLDPLRLMPIGRHPLYDLLEPDMRILVNLGYGSITEGWNQGPANVETPIGLFPTELDWSAVLPALGRGAQQGVTAFSNDLISPETYQFTPVVDSPALSTLIAAAYGGGDISNPHPSSLWDVLTSWNTKPPGSS